MQILRSMIFANFFGILDLRNVFVEVIIYFGRQAS